MSTPVKLPSEYRLTSAVQDCDALLVWGTPEFLPQLIAQYGGERELALANLAAVSEWVNVPCTLTYRGQAIATARYGLVEMKS